MRVCSRSMQSTKMSESRKARIDERFALRRKPVEKQMHCQLRYLFLAIFAALPALGGMGAAQAAAAIPQPASAVISTRSVQLGVQSEALSPQWSPLAVDFANF